MGDVVVDQAPRQPLVTAGQIEVELAGVEPVASFIAKVHRAWATFGELNHAEIQALPDRAARALLILQGAVEGLAGAQAAARGGSGHSWPPAGLETKTGPEHP